MKKQIITYVLCLMLVSWAVQIAAIIVTGSINSDAATMWLAANMLTPLIVTLIFLKGNPAFKQRLLWKPSRGILLSMFLSILVPILIGFATLLLLEKFELGSSDWFQFSHQGVTILGGPFLFGKGQQAWWLFLLNVFATGAAFALLNAFITTGEEFAWRGLLQPLLTEQLGMIKGSTLLGFIWSMWHLPALLNGYNYPDYPVLGALFIFPLRLIATSYFYLWLTKKANSFIPASLAHGALNGIQTAVVQHMSLRVEPIYEHLITLLLTIVFGSVFLAWSLKDSKKNKALKA